MLARSFLSAASITRTTSFDAGFRSGSRSFTNMSELRNQQGKRKIVVVGAGFVGSYIAKALVADSRNQVVLASRHPDKLHKSLQHLGTQLLPPASLDITSPSSRSDSPSENALLQAFDGADAVVSLVGILTGTPSQFEKIQKEGGETVALAAKRAGVKRVVMVSALGIDDALTPYARTKLSAERSFLQNNPESTIIRPSLVFGPGDSFFARFAQLAKYLPFLPVFGGGKSRFQPVYVGDVARAVEVATRSDKDVVDQIGGKIIEAGGPDVFTYRQLMELVLAYTGLSSRRLVISLPFWVGMIQGFFLEKLPESLFTVTRDQVKQLKADNKESDAAAQEGRTIADILAKFPPAGLSTAARTNDDPRSGLKSVHDIMPLYIGSGDKSALDKIQSGKRSHGRPSIYEQGSAAHEEVKRLAAEAEQLRQKRSS